MWLNWTSGFKEEDEIVKFYILDLWSRGPKKFIFFITTNSIINIVVEQSYQHKMFWFFFTVIYIKNIIQNYVQWLHKHLPFNIVFRKFYIILYEYGEMLCVF